MTRLLDEALRRIDAANSADPEGKELLYSQRMTEVLHALYPESSDALRLAVRAQHICRWKMPRDQYPAGKAGYKKWRSDLAHFHAQTAGEILSACGYDDAFTERVKALVIKLRFKVDLEAQALEDVACIVFLQYYFAPFAANHDSTKVIDIVRKTWVKMSPHGQHAAGKLELPDELRELVRRALTEPPDGH